MNTYLIDNISWFAGLFEGEGNIYRNDVKRILSMSMKMTDKDVVESIPMAIGLGRVKFRKSKNPKHKDTYEWCLTRRNDIIRLVQRMLPYMGDRRKNKMLSVISGLDFRPEPRLMKKVHISCGYVLPTDCTGKGHSKHNQVGESACPDCASAYRNYLRKWRLTYESNKPI